MKQKHLKDRMIVRLILAVILVSLVGITLYILLVNRDDCNDRNALYPDFPTHPDSELVEKYEYLDTSKGTVVEYTFVSSVPLGDVASYYRDFATCTQNSRSGFLVCEGSSQPFGSFTVHLDTTVENTSYRIVLAWNKCNAEWDEVNSFE